MCLLAGLLPWLGQAQPQELMLDSTRLYLRPVAQNLVIPYDLVWGPDDWIWFTERAGHIRRLNPVTGDLLTLHTVAEVFESRDNSGMYALALHPEFATKPWVYVHYTYELYASRLVRFAYDAACHCLQERQILLDSIPGHESHNGSRLAFGPDGMLYFTMGDAYAEETVQELSSLSGKILRLTPEGEVPADNPLPGNYLWSYGHRNPQGLVFLPSGALFSSEHGGGEDDELNRIYAGRNYGWPRVAGLCNTDAEAQYCLLHPNEEPLRTWSPTQAPAGLAWYDHAAIPEWRGCLLQVFLKHRDGSIGQRLEVIRLNAAQTEVVSVREYFAHTYGRLRDVLVAPDGRIFLATSNREWNGREVVQPGDDKILELRPEAVTAAPLSTESRRALAYPNPAEERFTVYLSHGDRLQGWRLLDPQGKTVLDAMDVPAETSFSVDASALSAGLYWLEVHWENGDRERQAFLIQR